jgi:hydrogenase maturation protease
MMPSPSLQEIICKRPLLVLGMGNPLRGDDAIGHLLAQELESKSDENFRVHAVGIAVENAMRWIREAAGGTVLLVDAVYDEEIEEGAWALYLPEQLDSVCHTTHSIPLSLLIRYWQNEVPGLQVHFLGISIRNNAEMAPLTPLLQQTLESLRLGVLEALS